MTRETPTDVGSESEEPDWLKCTCATRQYGDPLCPLANRGLLPSLPPGYAT